MTEEQKTYETAIVPIQQVFMPIDVGGAVRTWQAYQELCRLVLDENDYAIIRGKKARKRSGWTKLRRFLGVTADIQQEDRFELDHGDDWGYRFTVRAFDASSRYEDSDGACTYSELKANYDAAKAKGKDGIPPTEHNVRAKALTRAKNRATSDFLGAGEVSAEELDAPETAPTRRQTKATSKPTPKNSQMPSHWIDRGNARKALWRWVKTDLALSDKDVYGLLGIERIHDYQGTMQEFKDALLAAIDKQASAAITANVEEAAVPQEA